MDAVKTDGMYEYQQSYKHCAVLVHVYHYFLPEISQSRLTTSDLQMLSPGQLQFSLQ